MRAEFRNFRWERSELECAGWKENRQNSALLEWRKDPERGWEECLAGGRVECGGRLAKGAVKR